MAHISSSPLLARLFYLSQGLDFGLAETAGTIVSVVFGSTEIEIPGITRLPPWNLFSACFSLNIVSTGSPSAFAYFVECLAKGLLRPVRGHISKGCRKNHQDSFRRIDFGKIPIACSEASRQGIVPAGVKYEYFQPVSSLALLGGDFTNVHHAVFDVSLKLDIGTNWHQIVPAFHLYSVTG